MERRRQLWAMLAVCVVATCCPLTRGQFGGGSGTASDPYLIYNGEHLRAMPTKPGKPGNGVHYRLKADIDLEKVPMTPMGTPTAPFTVVIDGNGKTISNLKIVSPIRGTT